MKSFSPSETLSARLTAFFRCSKNSFAVGELLARPSSADAKFGSREMALSKCWRESCASSFSNSSRPVWNSFFASSELVVMGIFPFSEAALLQKPQLTAPSMKIASHMHRLKRIEIPPDVQKLNYELTATRRVPAIVSYRISDISTSSKG